MTDCVHENPEPAVNVGWYDGYFAGVFTCKRCQKLFWVVVEAYDAYDSRTLERVFVWVEIDEAAASAIARLDETEAELRDEDLKLILGGRRPSLVTCGVTIEHPSRFAVGVFEFDELIVRYRSIEESIQIPVARVLARLEEKGLRFEECG